MAAVREPLPLEEETEAQKVANILALLRTKSKKIAWNIAAINSVKQDVANIRQLFSEMTDTANNKIDQVQNKVNSEFVDVSTRDKPDGYDALVQRVSAVSDGISSISAGVSLLSAAGVNSKIWQEKKNKISDISQRIQDFSYQKKRVPFIELGTVTVNTFGDILQEKVPGSFAAVRGILEGSTVTGWWFKQGNSGNGLLFDHDSSRIFSLFKRSNGTVDIKIIYGSDTGAISDLTVTEKNFIAGLINAGLSSETWNVAVSAVADIQERQMWYNQAMAVGVSVTVWRKLISDILLAKTIQDIMSPVKESGLSVETWNKAVSLLWKEDNDSLTAAQQKFLSDLKIAGVSDGGFTKVLSDILFLKDLSNINNVGITTDSWQKFKQDLSNAKDIAQLMFAAKLAGLNSETWAIVKRVMTMTTEERNFLNELMSSNLSGTAWTKALEDIVTLQTTKTFVDSLISANLSAESWSKALSDIENLLETKTFIDELKKAGFSADAWSTVYSAALSADTPADDVTTEDDNTAGG